MNFTFTPSLEHRTLAKIATMLWNDTEALIENFDIPLPDSERSEKWQNIEDKVKEKLQQLPQPVPLKKEILGVIRQIGLKILNWMIYHRELLSEGDVKENLNKLFWTPQGTVDRKKTAEVLIKNENIAITERYRLACVYCLEDDVRELWACMVQKQKACFYFTRHPSFAYEQKLVVYWTNEIKGDAAELSELIKKIRGIEVSPYLFAYECALLSGNKTATEHFLQKLTPRERKDYLVRSTQHVACIHLDAASKKLPREHFAEVLCFLLSKMDEEQQIEIFKNHRYEVLECLLEWPRQSLFMETASRMSDFLSKWDYRGLITKIINKVIYGRNDFNYQNLARELWQQIPNGQILPLDFYYQKYLKLKTKETSN